LAIADCRLRIGGLAIADLRFEVRGQYPSILGLRAGVAFR
jgi:hypothetical protein